MINNLISSIYTSPQRTVISICLLQVVIWTLVPSLVYLSIPLDAGENMIWGQQWQWGYYKQPPLQAWVTEAAMRLSGNRVEAVYLTSQLFIAATIAAIFLLGREMGNAKRAAMAVAGYALLHYVNIPATQLNANLVQMPIWAWAGWALWKALTSGRTRYWLALGALLALGLYAKYSVIFLIIGLAAAALRIPEGRRCIVSFGPYLGAVVAVLLSLPHLHWLVVQSDYLPISYAVAQTPLVSGWGYLLAPLEFILSQAAVFSFALIMLILIRPRRVENIENAKNETTTSAIDFVDTLSIGTIGSMALYGIVTGAKMDNSWAIPAVAWLPLCVMLRLAPSASDTRRKVARYLWLLLFMLPVAAQTGYYLSAPHIGKTVYSAGEPGQAITARILKQWSKHAGEVPTIVAGSTRLIGMAHYFTPGRPEGFLETDFAANPWITPERLKTEGALFLWSAGPNPYTDFGAFLAQGTESVTHGKRTLSVSWGILPPASSGP